MLSAEGCRDRVRRLLDIRAGDPPVPVDLAVLTDRKTIYYFSAFLSQPYGWLLQKESLFAVYKNCFSVLLCSESERGLAAGTAADELVTYVDYDILTTTSTSLVEALGPLKRTLAKSGRNVEAIGIEKRHAPALVIEMLSELYPNARFVDITPSIGRMRTRKYPDEVELIEKTAEIADACYREVRARLRAGLSEIDLYALCARSAVREAGRYITFAGDFLSGGNTLKIGGPPTSRVLGKGDLVLLDLWTDPFGYWTDSARSFVVGGAPSGDQQRVHRLVLRALERGEERMLPGVPAKEVYEAVKKTFEEEGHGAYFTTHAGHGIGLGPHEPPLLIPGSEDVLEEGMVCTLEPGLYVPEIGGIRCENEYIITRTGPRCLTRSLRSL